MKRCRLIYKSIAYPESLKKEELSKLLEICMKNNNKYGIYGLLVLSGDRFLQVLEGPPKFVNLVFQKIVQDKRHYDVELISYEDIGTNYFYNWNMRLIDLEKLTEPTRELFLKKYPHNDRTIIYPDNLLLVYSLLLDARITELSV